MRSKLFHQMGYIFEIEADEDQFNTDEEDNGGLEFETDQSVIFSDIDNPPSDAEPDDDMSEVQFRIPKRKSVTPNKESAIRELNKLTADELHGIPAIKQLMCQMMDQRDKVESSGKSSHRKSNQMLKSPSDTTIYAPALKLTPDKDYRNIALDKNVVNCGPIQSTNQGYNHNIDKQISDFIENIQIQESPGQGRDCQVPAEEKNEETQPCPGTSKTTAEKLQDAENFADQMILQGERNRAALELPKGKAEQNLGTASTQKGLSDDEFFHLTCHVDPNLKSKIERGEYIDLEKLLFKDRFRGNNQNMNGQWLELISKG